MLATEGQLTPFQAPAKHCLVENIKQACLMLATEGQLTPFQAPWWISTGNLRSTGTKVGVLAKSASQNLPHYRMCWLHVHRPMLTWQSQLHQPNTAL